MFVKWSCWFLLITIIVLIDIDQTQCKSYSSRSSSSRTSSGSRSFGSGSHSSFGTSRNNGASRGSYGWTRTTSRPYTQRTTRRHYPVTTMPTRRTTRYHPITTMPTRRTTRYHPITTMPTRRTTQHHYPVTTMPTRRTTQHTRQPAFNPHYNNTSGGSHFGTTTKQPPFNPFFTTGHTRQPAVNPFFNRNNGSSFGQTTRKSIIGDQNNNHFRQTTPGSVFGNNRNNGSNFNTFGQSNRNNFSTGGNSQRPFEHTTKVAPVGTGNNVFGQPNRNNGSNVNSFGHNRNNGSVGINRPFEHTTKTVPVGSGNNVFGGRKNNSRPTNNNNWRTTQRPIYTTTRYKGPSYNTSSLNHGSSFRPGSNGQNIYQPPSVRRNTTYNTGSGIHPAYPTQPVVHPSPTHHTTVINNNNNHYYGGSSPHYNPGYYTPPGTVHTHVTVINQHNYNHHVIVPSRHYYSYGPPAVGVTVVNSHYYDTYPTYHTTYHYSTYDTGSTSLGFFLGYQLGRITRPSYYYHSTTYVNDAYVPRYDHYTVHYYNYNSANIPKEAPIQPNAIVVCAGDSSALCPPGNMPLCTNNGAVMCVVNAVNSSPCSNDKNTNCVKSTIPCQGNNSPECSQKQSAEISIPCVSTASIPAGVGFVNNSVIVTDANDSTVKNFCVTVLALPSKNETRKNTTATQPTEPPPPFRYTTNHTGVDLLGYYLGRKLQLLVEPSFGFLNYDEQYNFVEKFDHYNIFHYYHDANILPQQVDIRPEQIMNCAGDSGTFCPPFTASLCLNDGAVTCVTDISNTSFSNETQANYLNSTVSCEELKSPVCVPNQNLTVPIQIPCISTAKVYANVSYMIRTFGIGNNTQSYRTIELVNNTGNLTVQNITDPRQFCVAILALPGDKVVVKTPERRKVTGIENAPGYLALPGYSYKNISTSQVGAYLAYKLDKLRFPSYYWLNAYAHAQDGSIQKYDHYSVHHYFEGKEIIPDTLEFQAFDIRVCEGDTGIICPPNTSTVCLNDGGVMCMTDILLTNFCMNKTKTCVRTSLSCEMNRPCYKGNKNKKKDLPCISTATIYGDIMDVGHNVYKKVPASSRVYSDLEPVPGVNVNNTPVYHKAQQFCVTIVALPEERKISEGEKILESSDSLFGKFASKLFGSW